MDFYLPDIVGGVGVVLIIFSFFLLQIGKLQATSVSYLLLNIAGSLMMLFSLYHNWNLASVIIELLWLSISLYGLVRSLRKSAKN